MTGFGEEFEGVETFEAPPTKVAPQGWPPSLPQDLAVRRRHSIVRRRGTLIRRAFATSDVVALTSAFIVAESLYGFGRPAWGHFDIRPELLTFLVSLPVWLFVFKLYGLYGQDEEHTDHSTADEVVPVLHAVTIGTWLFESATWLTALPAPQFHKLFAFWAAGVAFVILGRAIARPFCRGSSSYIQNTIVVGSDAIGQLLARKLVRHPEYGLNLLGFVDEEAPRLDGSVDGVPFLGVPSELTEIIRDRDVERVILAGPTHDDQRVIHELKGCDVQIDIVPRLFEVLGPSIAIHKIEGISLLGLPPTRLSRTSLAVKRTVDLAGATAVLLLTAPLFAWIAWRLHRDSPGPVFFKQTRYGFNMRAITVIKFRTMRVDADETSHREYIKQIMDKGAAPNEDGLYKLKRTGEITPFGRWLRKTSLDELPQLVNVLKGEMSLVGPRPCVPYEIESYEPHHFERFSVPAGMTGLWQVTARARSTFIEALEMDVAYARDWSLGLDFWLLARTPLQIFRPKGTE